MRVCSELFLMFTKLINSVISQVDLETFQHVYGTINPKIISYCSTYISSGYYITILIDNDINNNLTGPLIMMSTIPIKVKILTIFNIRLSDKKRSIYRSYCFCMHEKSKSHASNIF